MPLLLESDDARVVSLSSIAAGRGQLDFADLQAEQRYNPYATYAQSARGADVGHGAATPQ